MIHNIRDMLFFDKTTFQHYNFFDFPGTIKKMPLGSEKHPLVISFEFCFKAPLIYLQLPLISHQNYFYVWKY